jgi:hypothetical protein
MERGVLLKEAPNTVDSPYTGEAFEKVDASGASTTSTYGVSASSARMMMASDAQSEQFRWSGRGVDNNAQNKRRREVRERGGETKKRLQKITTPQSRDARNQKNKVRLVKRKKQKLTQTP